MYEKPHFLEEKYQGTSTIVINISIYKKTKSQNKATPNKHKKKI